MLDEEKEGGASPLEENHNVILMFVSCLSYLAQGGGAGPLYFP